MLLPFLKAKINHSWLDPRKAGDKDEFFYQYVTAWGFAQSAEEILQWIESMLEAEVILTKKERGEDKDPIREALS